MRNYLIIFIFTTLSLNSQGFKRQFKLPGVYTSITKAVFEIPNGNYIASGIIIETINNKTSNKLAIMGLNQNGQLLWTKKYGDSNFEHLENPLMYNWLYKRFNFIYYAGSIRDSNNKDIGVLMKFDFNGDTLWQKVYKGINEDITLQAANPSSDGGFLLVGITSNTINNDFPCLVVKTDANGNELWRKKINKSTPNVQDGKAIIQDSASKKIVIVGYQNIGSPTPFNVNDNILILDSLGNKIKQLNYTGNYGGALVNLIQTQDKKFVAVGSQYTSKVIGGNNLQTSFAVKFDINAPNMPIWVISGYDKPGLYNQYNCITELNNGDLMLGGGIDTMFVNNLNINAYSRLTKVSSNGTVKWNRYFDYKSNGPNENNNQQLISLNPTSDQGFIAAIEVLNNPNPNPMFFVKFDSTGCDSSAVHCATLDAVGIEELTLRRAHGGELRIWPNPVIDIVNLEAPGINGELELKIFDVYGLEVKRTKINKQTKLDLRNLSKGVYFVSVYTEGKLIYKSKLIKE